MMSKKEIGAFDQSNRIKLAQYDFLKELVWRELQQCMVGRVDHDGVDAVLLKELQLVIEQTQCRRRLLRTQQGNRMRIERHHDSRSPRRIRLLDQLGQHALMAAMHAIEIADRDPAAAVLIRLLKAALDVHLWSAVCQYRFGAFETKPAAIPQVAYQNRFGRRNPKRC